MFPAVKYFPDLSHVNIQEVTTHTVGIQAVRQSIIIIQLYMFNTRKSSGILLKYYYGWSVCFFSNLIFLSIFNSTWTSKDISRCMIAYCICFYSLYVDVAFKKIGKTIHGHEYT